MLVGYVRVSTSDQETAMQLSALRRAGVRSVVHETASGVSQRPQLQKLLARIKRGDVLVVWKLDRLARSLRDLLVIMDKLQAVGCGLRSLTEPIDTSSALGEFVVLILGAVAQFERRLIRERSIAGQVEAYRRGTRWGGRAPSLSKAERVQVRRLYRSRRYTMEEIGAQFGVSRSTVSRAIRPSGPRVTYRPLPVLGQYLQACA